MAGNIRNHDVSISLVDVIVVIKDLHVPGTRSNDAEDLAWKEIGCNCQQKSVIAFPSA
jgi:hypothetical protein